MISANQIPGFLIQPFLQSKSMKQCNSLHVDTKSQKLIENLTENFLVGHGGKEGLANLVSGL